jgi:hypothetical protein
MTAQPPPKQRAISLLSPWFSQWLQREKVVECYSCTGYSNATPSESFALALSTLLAPVFFAEE